MAILHEGPTEGDIIGQPEPDRRRSFKDFLRKHPFVAAGAGLCLTGALAAGVGVFDSSDSENTGATDVSNGTVDQNNTSDTIVDPGSIIIDGIEFISAGGPMTPDDTDRGRPSGTFTVGIECDGGSSPIFYVEQSLQPAPNSGGAIFQASCFDPKTFEGQGLFSFTAPTEVALGGDNFHPDTDGEVTATLPYTLTAEQQGLYDVKKVWFMPDNTFNPVITDAAIETNLVQVAADSTTVEVTPILRGNSGDDDTDRTLRTGYLGEVEKSGDTTLCTVTVDPNGGVIAKAGENDHAACSALAPRFDWQ